MKLKPPWTFENPLCAEIGPQYFYLEDDGLEFSRSDANKIKELCNTCEHQFDCAEWGIKKERFGVWGGLSTRERALIRRKRRLNPPEEQLSLHN